MALRSTSLFPKSGVSGRIHIGKIPTKKCQTALFNAGQMKDCGKRVIYDVIFVHKLSLDFYFINLVALTEQTLTEKAGFLDTTK